VKVSVILCVWVAAFSTQLLGCGDAANRSEPEPARTSGTAENNWAFASNGDGGATSQDAEAADSGIGDECSVANANCGQISLTLKGVGSNCHLVPTVNDLTRPPRSVRFDCRPLELGPNGYDFDELGHITLMGDTCAALAKSGPHRVTLVLGCPPS